MSNRVIKDSIWKSKTLAKLQPYHQDQWPRWLLMADDWGCFDADPEIIKGLVYPKRKERVKEVKSIAKVFFDAGLLFLWAYNDREWGFFIKWDSHQYVGATEYDNSGNRARHRRKTPEPPKDLLDKYLEKFGAIRNNVEQDGTNYLNPNPNPNPNPICSNFGIFWQSYPRKKSKGDAEKAWKALKPNQLLLETILKGIERAKTSVEWADPQYIPYPARWLRVKGWEDELRQLCKKCKGKGKFTSETGYVIDCDCPSGAEK